MSSSDLPQPAHDAVQKAVAAITQLDPLRNALVSIDRVAQQQTGDLGQSIAAAEKRLGQQWAEQINQALSTEALFQRINDAMDVLARDALQQVQAFQRIDLSLDMSGLDRVLQDVGAWHALDAEQRASATHVLDDVYQVAQSRSEDEIPDDLIVELAETAQTFAASQDGLLTPERQRQLFVYFCGLLVLLALMQASFTSEQVDAVIEKTIALSPAAVLAMAAAGKSWDKFVRRPENEETVTDEDNGDASS